MCLLVQPYPLISIIYLCLKRQAFLYLRPVLVQILRPYLRCRPLSGSYYLTLAKETIGYTPAPSALLQSQLGMPRTSLGLCHNKPLLKSSLQSPQKLYTGTLRVVECQLKELTEFIADVIHVKIIECGW
jgi:hypothetical protein